MIAIYVLAAPFHAWGAGDALIVIRSTIPTLACLKAGQFVGCNIHSAYPLFQFFPAMALHLIGFEERPVGGGLILLNLAAFFGMFGLGIRMFRNDRTALLLFFLLLLSSPFWVYAISSFGETLAAFLTLLFVVACMQRKNSWLVLLTFVAAGLTKETAAPILFLLGLAAGPAMDWRPGQAFRKHVFQLFAGVALTILLSALWNIFRYGVPWNLDYAVQAGYNTDILQNLRFFAALWVAPYAGLLLFWPALALTIIAIIITSRSIRAWLIALVVLAITAGLSRWWGPFGGDCYGQRYMLPWLPACAAVLIYYERRAVDRILAKITRNRWTAMAVLVGLFATTLPHLLASQGWKTFHDVLQAHYLAEYPFLSEHVNPDVNPSIYYRDTNVLMWTPDSDLLIIVMEGLRQPKFYPLLILSLICLGHLFLDLRGARSKTQMMDER